MVRDMSYVYSQPKICYILMLIWMKQAQLLQPFEVKSVHALMRGMHPRKYFKCQTFTGGVGVNTSHKKHWPEK